MSRGSVEQAKKAKGSGVRGRMPDGSPNAVDIHVGSRVRMRRTLLGMSQERLGEALGITFQQIQKYERGDNRIGSSRLYDLARVLDVPLSFFFDDMPNETQASSPAAVASGSAVAPLADTGRDPLERRETLELVRAYYRISDAGIRRTLLELIKTAATAPG